MTGHSIGNRHWGHKHTAQIIALVVAATSKFLILYIGVAQIAVPLLLGLPEPQASVISNMFSLPMECQVNMRVMFPAMINGIRLQSGPIPISFAMTGEITAAQSPDIIPQVITETTSSIFTTDP